MNNQSTQKPDQKRAAPQGAQYKKDSKEGIQGKDGSKDARLNDKNSDKAGGKGW